jgi:hypothetical protein
MKELGLVGALPAPWGFPTPDLGKAIVTFMYRQGYILPAVIVKDYRVLSESLRTLGYISFEPDINTFLGVDHPGIAMVQETIKDQSLIIKFKRLAETTDEDRFDALPVAEMFTAADAAKIWNTMEGRKLGNKAAGHILKRLVKAGKLECSKKRFTSYQKNVI